MNKLQEEIVVQEVVRNELKQTVSSQPIYERFGGNVFLPVSRTKALMNCEGKKITITCCVQINCNFFSRKT
ncbi:unnamed protein product [Heterobilharzia americana]|nr:unnamed protein product [Heterobilharzia americana]CAH8627944.1 unnamed protein product [Heterobilharzia americana]